MEINILNFDYISSLESVFYQTSRSLTSICQNFFSWRASTWSSCESPSIETLRGRVYPISTSGYPNLFFSETDEEKQITIALLEKTVANVISKLEIPYLDENQNIQFTNFLEKIEKIVHLKDPQSKVYLGGGSIRSILSYVYGQLLLVHQAGGDPREALTGFANQSKQFPGQKSRELLSIMDVLGVGSDLDIYIQFSNTLSDSSKSDIIQNVRSFMNSSSKDTSFGELASYIFPVADVKEYELQINRATKCGGSTLDWLVFPISKASGSKFVLPQACEEILSNLLIGKLAYHGSMNAEDRACTTLRVYRSLFELPFLELDELNKNRLYEDLVAIEKKFSYMGSWGGSAARAVFRKVFRNTRYADRVNFEVKCESSDPVIYNCQKALKNIAKSIAYYSNFKTALPELLPLCAKEPLDLDLLNEFDKHNLFINHKDFVDNHTNQGLLYHGTPETSNLISMLRGCFAVSSRFQGNAVYGRGLYSTPDRSLALDYADDNDDAIFSFSVKENARIVNLKNIPDDFMHILRTKAEKLGIDENEYLFKYLHVDVVVNYHVIIQDTQCIKPEINNILHRFLIKLASDKLSTVQKIKMIWKDFSLASVLKPSDKTRPIINAAVAVGKVRDIYDKTIRGEITLKDLGRMGYKFSRKTCRRFVKKFSSDFNPLLFSLCVALAAECINALLMIRSFSFAPNRRFFLV